MEYGNYFANSTSTDLTNPFMNFTPVSNSNGSSTNNSLTNSGTPVNIYSQYAVNPYNQLNGNVPSR